MRFLQIRQEKRLSQREIAEILAITSQQYYLYEKGKRQMPLDLVIKLADYYDVSIDYLVGRN